MRLGSLLTFIFFHVSNLCFCQSPGFHVSLFYEINQVQSGNNFKRLDSVCALIKENAAEIKITGYADYLGTYQSNKRLSEERAFAIKNFLLRRAGGEKIKIIECIGVGELNSKPRASRLGVPADRRVDVYVVLSGINQVNSMERNSRKYMDLDTSDQAKAEAPPGSMKYPAQDLSKKINELKKGETLAIEGLLFVPGRHVALQSSMPVLKQLVTILNEHENLKIEIQGHICCLDGQEDGFDYDNLDKKLSENRAKAVYEYLLKNGIEAGRLTYKGYGHKNPKIYPELNPVDEQMNRRVEIKVLEE